LKILYKDNQKNFDIKTLSKILKKYTKKRGSLIAILQETQNAFGYLPQKALLKIAEDTNTDVSQIYGVATFYTQFRLKPIGRHLIRVCHGTACHVSGAVRITEICEEEIGIREGETSIDLEYTLESVACLGCCSLAPVITIDDNTYGRLTDRELRKVIKSHKK
jgi:NADH-quinone oxidoreductase subunit E